MNNGFIKPIEGFGIIQDQPHPEGYHEIPVAPNKVPPPGCPKHWIKSTDECSGPTSSSVCLEFCPLGPGRQERHLG